MKFVKTSTAFSPNNVHCLSQHSKHATHVESKVNLSREWGWGALIVMDPSIALITNQTQNHATDIAKRITVSRVMIVHLLSK